jgi:hypothetical protein
MDQEHHHKGRVPVVIYMAHDAAANASQLAECRSFADARNWEVVTEASDCGISTPLDQRAGWQIVMEAISAGHARGVVTATQGMVASCTADYTALCASIVDDGAFLTSCESGASPEVPVIDKPIRRSGQERLRRSVIYEAASWPSIGGPRLRRS